MTDRPLAAAKWAHNHPTPEGATAASPQREAGFNYGQPLPYDPLNPVIVDGTVICNRLREAAQAASATSWEMEMACRAYRIAETAGERERAAVKLAALNTKHKLAAFDALPVVKTEEMQEPTGYRPCNI